MPKQTVVGLDLAGSPKNPSGFAELRNNQLDTEEIYSDDDILERCTHIGPRVVAIDAPLSLPVRGNLRVADKSLIARGCRVFPPTFGGMKSLTARGMDIASRLRANGIKVIEIHPRTSGMIMFGSPDRAVWVSALEKRGLQLKQRASEHEIDAAMAAVTGLRWLKKKVEEVGDPREGVIITPRGPQALERA